MPAPDALAIAAFLVSALLAIVTGFLFFATKNMAAETKRLADKTSDMAEQTAALARETVEASDRADEHHQQGLWPLVVARNVRLTTKLGHVWLLVDCKNIGAGPSESGHISITGINSKSPLKALGSGVPPCGVGEVIEVSVELDPALDAPAAVIHVAFSISYSTIFDSYGSTQWSCSRDRAGDLEIFWGMPFKRPDIRKRPQL